MDDLGETNSVHQNNSSNSNFSSTTTSTSTDTNNNNADGTSSSSKSSPRSKSLVPKIFPPLLPTLFSLPSLQFPALALPGKFLDSDGRTGESRDERIYYSDSPHQKPEECSFILWGFTLVMLSDFLRLFDCHSLHRQLEKGKPSRQRMLQVLYRTIEVQESMEKFKQEWREHGLAEAIKHTSITAMTSKKSTSKKVPPTKPIDSQANVVEESSSNSTSSASSDGEVDVSIDSKLAEALTETKPSSAPELEPSHKIDMRAETVEKQKQSIKQRHRDRAKMQKSAGSSKIATSKL